jgi:O-antigen/teichoic acid export membrane protein
VAEKRSWSILGWGRSIISKLPEEVANFGALAVSTMVNQVVRFFTGIINARLLAPSLYAVSTLSTVVAKYVSYAHLGVQNGANRQIPIEVGREQQREADIYAGTAFWVVVAISAASVALASVMWFLPGSDLIPREYYFDFALYSIAGLVYQYFTSWLVSTARSPMLAELRARYDLPGIVITTISLVFFGLHGMLFVQSASMLLQSAVVVVRTRFRPAAFSFRHAKTLLNYGWPILASSLLIYVFMTIDLLFVTSRYSRVAVGLYGFALNGAFFYRMYSQSMADVLQPKMGQEFGAAEENAESLGRFAVDYTYALAPIFGMIAAVFYLGIPIVIDLFLPSYRGAVAPFQFLLLAEFVLSLYVPAGHALTLMRKQGQLIVVILLGCALAAGLFLVFLPKNAPLGYVSLIWLVVSVVVSYAIILMATWFTSAKGAFPFGKTLRNLGTASIVVVVMAGLGGWSFWNNGLPAFAEAIVRLAVLEVVLFVLLISLDPKNPIAARVRTIIVSAGEWE